VKIEFSKIVDLSHETSKDMPIWPGDPATEISTLKHENYIVEKLCLGTHTGTHVGTSQHFGLKKSVSDLNVQNLFLKAAVVDVSKKSKIPILDENFVKDWEKAHENLNFDAVLLRTDQDMFWNDEKKYFSNYAGFDVNAIRYFLSKGVKIFGTDAPGIDPSSDKEFHSNYEIFRNDGIHIENLTNLDKLPVDRTFWIFIGALKMKTGGSPARVVAFV
jgi:arylformamidase